MFDPQMPTELDAWIIEEIWRKEQERIDQGGRPQLEIEIRLPEPKPKPEEPEPVKIDL